MSRKDSKYFNRELSWIEFNRRVMEEACRQEYPLLERFKFLSITSSNFDEFFMIRVAGVKRTVLKKESYDCPSKISAPELIEEVSKSTHKIINEQYKVLKNEILPGLKKAGIELCLKEDLSKQDLKYLAEVFHSEIFPVLTPLQAVSSKATHNFGNLQLYNAFILEGNGQEEESKLAVVPLPHSLERICSLPAAKGKKRFILLDEIVKIFAAHLFPGYTVSEASSFRLTKDMDLAVDEDDDQDFLAAMSEVLIHRQKSFPVRLEISKESEGIRRHMTELLGLTDSEVYDIDGMLDLKSLFDLCFIPGYEDLKVKPWPPCKPQGLVENTDIFTSIKEKDILLHHPYETFDPVIEMVDKASTDPNVLSIKMTLYRTSGGDSPIVNSLIKAAMNNKQVTVLVELKARFDEKQNIVWAKKLEEVGATVIYGVADLKVHCKYLMIIRREEDAVRRYLHLGTGNYNEKTAGIYGDMALLTCRDDLTYEACIFFNSITGYSVIPHLSRLVMAPTMLKNKILTMIKREKEIAKQGGSGLIMCKTNAISDPDVIEALYDASCAGVEVKLNVRGICMLVPGQKGLSENIDVVSIIGRYLEHSRIYYFKNNGDEEIYLASADLMTRNLERRIELMFPLLDECHAQRAKEILEFYFCDNELSHKLLANGKYEKLSSKKSFNCHELFYREAKKQSTTVAIDSSELKVRRKQK